MSNDLKFQVLDIKGDEYYLMLLGTRNPIYFNRTNGFIGTLKFITTFIGRKTDGNIYKNVMKYINRYPSESMPVCFHKKSSVLSKRVINYMIGKYVPQDNQKDIKLKVKKLYEELQRICTENATVSPANDAISVITDNDNEDASEHDTIMELTSLFEEAMEEPTIDELNRIVASITDNLLLNQTVAVCKNNDDTLEVLMKDITPNIPPNKNCIFAGEYLIRAVEVYRLLDKLHGKGIIADINGDTLTVDDTDFFIDALSYKLMKISERNKANDTNSVSTES